MTFQTNKYQVIKKAVSYDLANFILPAWLWHCVEPNLSKEIRISVSFNFLQKGFNV